MQYTLEEVNDRIDKLATAIQNLQAELEQLKGYRVALLEMQEDTNANDEKSKKKKK